MFFMSCLCRDFFTKNKKMKIILPICRSWVVLGCFPEAGHLFIYIYLFIFIFWPKGFRA